MRVVSSQIFPAATTTSLRTAHHALDSDVGARWAQVLVQLGVPQRHLLRLHPSIGEVRGHGTSLERELRAVSRHIWSDLADGFALHVVIARHAGSFADVQFSKVLQREGRWAFSVRGAR